MLILKNSIVVVALLVAMSPCSHAIAHHDHGDAAGRCALDDSPCECHSCEHHQPCTERVEVQAGQVPVFKTIEHPPILEVFFTFPEPKPGPGKAILPASDVLVALQSIQLLI